MRDLNKVPEFVILSACKGIDKHEDIENTILLEDDLIEHGLAYKLVDGCYKGKTEESFYIELDRNIGFGLIAALDLAREYGQESILHVNEDREACLHYCSDSDRSDHVGTFVQVGEHEAKAEDNYTYDLHNKGYYICK